MFGYITMNEDELKIKDYKTYRKYYCGLCRCLKEQGGRIGQLTLSFDMTFLAILLTSLYECSNIEEKHRCITHPTQKHDMLMNKFSEYAADMNILLSYHNLRDDWDDEKKLRGLVMSGGIRKRYVEISKKYERQSRAVVKYMKRLSEGERSGMSDLDTIAGWTGELLGEIYVYKLDEWEENLRQMGFFLGKFIYLMDAYEDVDKDKKNNCFNPLKCLSEQEDFDNICMNMLMMMAAESSRAFEKLPILENGDILRNILYSGIWTKFEAVRKQRSERKD